jgi:two-component system nitrate/nitrite response regulator NarL
MINIVIADDHRIMLDGLRALIEKEEGITIIGEALSGDEILAILKYQVPDIVVMDIEMPKLNGIETSKLIKANYPDTKIIVLTLYKNPGIILQMLNIGISGYIIKEKGSEELITAIYAVASGKDYFDNEVKTIIIDTLKNPIKNNTPLLTKREIQVLGLIGTGLSTKEIAESLIIAESTVETHRRNLLEKLNIPNSKLLIKYAIENGYLK